MELITFFIYVIAGGYGILLLMMIWAEWYWEQEFPQLKPVKRRGNRRYYQRQDVLIIRQIRSLKNRLLPQCLDCIHFVLHLQ